MHNLPKGVTKVVRSLDSLERGVCQNPLLTSSLEKIFEFTSAAELSSAEDTGYTSRWTALFRCVGSMSVMTATFGFGTTMIPEHQEAGPVTGEITPCSSILSVSCFTFGRRGCATFLGVYRQKGVTLSLSLIEYSFWSFSVLEIFGGIPA